MKYSYAYLDQQRRQGDHRADLLVHELFANQEQHILYASFANSISELQSSNHPVHEFLLTKQPSPSWLDEATLEKGLAFYHRYALPIMMLLGGLSLPYCYAGVPGNKALYLSEKMRKNTLKRVIDTAEFVITVCSPRSIYTHDQVVVQINKTRLIHALARHHIIKAGQWDDAWGVPINQEDQAGTNLAFSYMIVRGLERSGYLISKKEEESYLHLWRYIGYLLQIDEELLPANFDEASRMERTIRSRNFKKSMEGTELTKELLDFYRSIAPPSESPLVESQVRYWLGEEVADILELNHNKADMLLVTTLNFFRDAGNYKKITTSSYAEMLENHTRLKNLA